MTAAANDIVYDVALSMALRYHPAIALELWRTAGGGRAVWDNRGAARDIARGVTPRIAELIEGMDKNMPAAEREVEYAEKNGIKCLSVGDADYPSRLKECADAPVVLFYKGTANLNARHIIAVVGTRHCTDYGREMCAALTQDLAAIAPGTLVISGLAYGIDIHAHRGALKAGLPTVAVLAHGLDRIYPSLHRDTARKMLLDGGLATEFPTGTNPDKQNFVSRNRIIAGLADATVVVESAEKGGGLITASIAQSYNRDVCAFPGRANDEYSAGCNRMIVENKAQMITSASDLANALCWDCAVVSKPDRSLEPKLFPDLSDDEKRVVSALEGSDGKQINLLTVETNIPVNQLMTMLFKLEMQGVVKSLNGARYKLNK